VEPLTCPALHRGTEITLLASASRCTPPGHRMYNVV